MTIDDTYLEEVLKGLLQKDLHFSIKNKTFKKGKLILFKQNNYHVALTIKNNKDELKNFEIPIPFDVEVWEEDDLVFFDYRITTLAKNNPDLQQVIRNLPRDGNNKFYDTICEIKIK